MFSAVSSQISGSTNGLNLYCHLREKGFFFGIYLCIPRNTFEKYKNEYTNISILDIYVCGKLVRFLYKSEVHSGEPIIFKNFTEPQAAC